MEGLPLLVIPLLGDEGLGGRKGVVHAADGVAVADGQACGSSRGDAGGWVGGGAWWEGGVLGVGVAPRADARNMQQANNVWWLTNFQPTHSMSTPQTTPPHPTRHLTHPPFISGGKPRVKSLSCVSSGPMSSSGRFISTLTMAWVAHALWMTCRPGAAVCVGWHTAALRELCVCVQVGAENVVSQLRRHRAQHSHPAWRPAVLPPTHPPGWRRRRLAPRSLAPRGGCPPPSAT